jgi:protein O-mannosyl-transferase
MSRQRLMLRIGWLAILALVGLAYMNALHAPFVYDDKIEVVGNSTIRDLSQLGVVIEYNVSRMLLILSYAWNFRSFGLEPFGYHITSLAIHGFAVAAALVFLVRVGRLGGHSRPSLAALVAACLWAIHPMATEGVTYITGRSESLCALFVLSTMAVWAGALLQEREQAGLGRVGRLVAVGLCVLAMGTKEVAVMTPFALLGMERMFRRAPDGTERATAWAWYVPFAGAILLGVAARAVYAEHFIPAEVDRSLLTQLSTQAEVWLRYLGLWIWPANQTIYHHVNDVAPVSLRGGVVWCGLGVMVAVARRWARSRPLVGFALLCAALFLVPSSSVVALKESMAEHRAYVTGLYLLAALVWSVPVVRAGRMMAVSALLVPVLITLTMARNRVWSSEVGLWAEATRLRPSQAEAWYGLGDAHRFAGDFERAIESYETALERDPRHLDSWNNLGIARANTGDVHGAEAAWRGALSVKRNYCKAHANLGFLAHSRGQIEEAVVEFTTTLSYCPDNLVAHYGLGTIYADERRNPERAVGHFETLLELAPDFSRAEAVRVRLLELTW